MEAQDRVKEPIPRSAELLDRIIEAHRPLLIAIDGADGIGKSSLASWLAWQLAIPTVHLDLFITSLHPIQWLTADLKRAVDRRLDLKRPLIVEGVLALDALDQIGRKADFVVYVKGVGSIGLADQLVDYQEARSLPGSADFSLEGYSD
jgi:ATP-dependent protease Clp ATPase subunit